jgi:hypothetical protein
VWTISVAIVDMMLATVLFIGQFFLVWLLVRLSKRETSSSKQDSSLESNPLKETGKTNSSFDENRESSSGSSRFEEYKMNELLMTRGNENQHGHSALIDLKSVEDLSFL